MVVGESVDLTKPDEIVITLLCYQSFSMFWNISGGLFTPKFYLWIRSGLKSSLYKGYLGQLRKIFIAPLILAFYFVNQCQTRVTYIKINY